MSLSILVTGPLSNEQVGGEQVDMVNDSVQNSGSKSPGSGANFDHQMTDKRDSFNAQHLEYYSNVGLVQDNSASYTPSQLQERQDAPDSPRFAAETSEMWISPRDLPAFRSDSYYNMAGLTHHAAYVPSHTGYGSFNAAPDAAQSSHMQFQGLYHHLQPAMENPQHLGNAMANNVGARGVQVDAYQQSQLSHLNWNVNF